MSPRGRARVTEIAIAAAFAGGAAALFGEDRPWQYLLAWLAVHIVYGLVSGSFWALAVALACPPLFVAGLKPDGGDGELWVAAAFVAAFYGVPLTFMGVVARRLWRLRRRGAELPEGDEGERSGE